MRWSESCIVVSNSLQPHGLYSPWKSPGQNTGVGSLSLLQGIFPSQGLNPGLLHCRWILYELSHKGRPRILEWVGRKWRGTKELPIKSERGEWKSWFKTQHSKNKDHGIWSHHFMGNRWGNNGNSVRLYFLGLQNHCESSRPRNWTRVSKVWLNTHQTLAMGTSDFLYDCKSYIFESCIYPSNRVVVFYNSSSFISLVLQIPVRENHKLKLEA